MVLLQYDLFHENFATKYVQPPSNTVWFCSMAPHMLFIDPDKSYLYFDYHTSYVHIIGFVKGKHFQKHYLILIVKVRDSNLLIFKTCLHLNL